MKEILKKYRQWFYLQKLYWRLTMIFGAGAVFLLLLFCLWSKYWFILSPFNLRSRVALDKLALSCYNEPVCHEDCFLERERYRQLIVVSWQKIKWKNVAVGRMINDEENECLRLELGELWGDTFIPSDWPLPLEDYFSSNMGDLVFKAKLGQALGFQNNNLESELISLINNRDALLADRYQALKVLSAVSDSDHVPFFIELFKRSDHLKFKEQALVNLSGMESREIIVSSGFLSDLLDFLGDPEADIYLKKNAVFLLSEYQNEKLVSAGLNDLWENEASVDKFTRAFLADILQISSEKRPTISATEWQDYSQNSIAARPLE